jgi:hypothetical protein
MSNLNSIFDTLRGWPDASALAVNFKAAAGVSLPAGTIVTQQSLQLASAKVLKIVDDDRVTAPTLLAANAGNAYVVAGVGGAWSTFHIGDIVEWSGTAWVKIVTHVESEVPDGTRVVVTGGTAAGSFTGLEEKVLQYTYKTVSLVSLALGYTSAVPSDVGKPVVGTGSGDTGTLVSYNNGTRTWIVNPTTPADVFAPADALAVTGGTGVGTCDTATPAGASWAATTPVDNQQLLINGTGGVYVGKQVQYQGTHPAGAWVVLGPAYEAVTYVDKLTSAAHSNVAPDSAWMVIEGNDQFDGAFTGSVTCVKLGTGVAIKVASTAANTLAPGDFLYANAGVLTENTGGTYNTVAQVLESNNTAGSGGIITIVA